MRVRIPLHWSLKRKAPISGSLSKRVVGDEGCPRAAGAARFRFVASLLACCAGKRFAFPQLRTLAGSNPSATGPKTKGPHCWRPIKSVVGDEGCRVRLRRPLPLRRLAPRVLRWKTLTRFLSSAPWRVRILLHWSLKRKAPISGSLSKRVVGDEGCRVRLRRPLPLRRLAPRVLRWKTLTRFLSFAPLRVRIPCTGL